MLGALVSSSAAYTDWNWNVAGDQITAGTYILRFTGVTSDGIPFVESKQLKVTK